MANYKAPGGYIAAKYINAVNTPTASGAQDPVTGASYPTGATRGDIIVLSAEEATALQAPTTTLYEGTYQLVQVDSAATAANCTIGKAAYTKYSNGVNAVTDASHADAVNAFAGVFINPTAYAPTPGSHVYIFRGNGRVNLAFGTLTNGSPAIGDIVNTIGTAGLFDDASATALTSRTVGIATAAPATNTTSVVLIQNDYSRP
jgi:hypothetical protein